MTTENAQDRTHRHDEPLLRFNSVTAGYGATTILQDISFDVTDGEVVGIIGRNGVGKTTTLQTIMGNITPETGMITYDGTDITDSGPKETVRHGMALVPEERRVFHSLSIRENLELAQLSGADGEYGWSIDDALDTFDNLAERETSPGSTLSGGEQQMLAIARALVSNARFLMLDEPTEGLAPYIIERVVDTLANIKNQGFTVLLVEQNIHVALDVCDYVYVMDNGRIVYQSPSAVLKDDDEILDRYLGVSI